MIFAQEKLYGPFLWMEFHCLNSTEPIWGDSLLFTTESPGVVPWSHLVVFNLVPLDWKSSSLNSRPLQDEVQIKLYKNEQLPSLKPKWRYWWPTVAVYLFFTSKANQKKSHFQGGWVIIIWHEGTKNRCKKVYQFKTIFCLVGHNF